MTEPSSTEPRAPAAGSREDYPNFDYLRLGAAGCVLLSHGIAIAQGNDRHDPMIWLLGKDIPTGSYAVCVFFIISGFLITRSAREGRGPLPFIAARALRIFPGLFICQLLTAVFIGGLFSRLAFTTYLAHGYPFTYALRHTLDPGMTWEIPTVVFYQDEHAIGRSFNASLWSIQQELFCYVLVAGLAWLRMLDWRVYVPLLVMSLPFFVPWSRDNVDVLMALVEWRFEETRVSEFFWVGSSFFVGGMLYFFWQKTRAFPRWPLGLCVLVLLVSLIHDRVFDYFPLYAGYPLLYWATSPTAQLPSLKRVGDLSYGVYLFGWPYEQTVRGLLGPSVTWWQVLLIAGSASVATAYLSWRYIEEPALSLKRYLYRDERSPVSAQPLPVTVGD